MAGKPDVLAFRAAGRNPLYEEGCPKGGVCRGGLKRQAV
jgi:hypothetical protein